LAYCGKRGLCYLLGCGGEAADHRFIIDTDHRNLEQFWKLKSPKISNWWGRLSSNDFIISHISGDSMGLPDTLSRIKCAPIASHLDSYTPAQINELLDLVHNALVGHTGADNMCRELVAAGYTWPNMHASAVAFIKACWVCQKCRLGQGSVDASRKVITALAPFSDIQMDTIGPLPADMYGK
jgi:hypothetical protein